MFKIALSILLFLHTLMANAAPEDALPDNFSAVQIKDCAQCVSLVADGTPIASLYPSKENGDIFFLLDQNNQKKVILRRGSTEEDYAQRVVHLNFKAYVLNGKKATAVTKFKLRYPMKGFAFDFFSLMTPYEKSDGRYRDSGWAIWTKQAIASFRTKTYFRLYDFRKQEVKYELGYITRPLFTFSLDSKVTIQDKKALLSLVNPYIFYATMAMYSNTDFLYDVEKRVVPQIDC